MKQGRFSLGSMLHVFEGLVFPFLTTHGVQCGPVDEHNVNWFYKPTELVLESGAKQRWGFFNQLKLYSLIFSFFGDFEKYGVRNLLRQVRRG